jgi:hypothetical protein
MFDASAYDLAELEHDGGSPATAADEISPPLAATGDDPATSPLEVAMAACSLCTQTFGGCAIGGVKAGFASPVLALSVCGWMQRAAERAVRWNDAGRSGTYLAYVLLGNGRSGAERETDLLALAETMR